MNSRPYIAVELDALKRCPDVARAAGISEHVAIAGLVRLWAYCWEAKNDSIKLLHLSAFFDAREPQGVADSLEAFGFLESTEGNAYRVRGAARYLRLEEGRRKGGLAAAKNLIPGGPRVKKAAELPAELPAEPQPRVSREGAEGEPRGEPRESREGAQPKRSADLGSTPSTEHRTPNTINNPPTPLKAKPQRVPFVERAQQVFMECRGSAYRTTLRDEQAGRTLLGMAQEDEVLRRWGIGLRSRFPACHSLADLVKNWNAYAQEAPAPQSQGGGFGVKPSNFTRPGGVDGITKAAKVDGDPCAWVDLEMKGCGGVGVEDVAGQWLCQACADVSKDYWAKEAAAK